MYPNLDSLTARFWRWFTHFVGMDCFVDWRVYRRVEKDQLDGTGHFDDEETE